MFVFRLNRICLVVPSTYHECLRILIARWQFLRKGCFFKRLVPQSIFRGYFCCPCCCWKILRSFTKPYLAFDQFHERAVFFQTRDCIFTIAVVTGLFVIPCSLWGMLFVSLLTQEIPRRWRISNLVIFSYYHLLVYIVTLFSVPFGFGSGCHKVWRVAFIYPHLCRMNVFCVTPVFKLSGKFIPTILYVVSFIRQTKLAVGKQRTEVQDNLFWLTCSRYKNIYPLNNVILKFQASSEKQIRFIGTLTT